MAALDIIWLYLSSAFLLILIAVFGFFIFKIGIFSFKIISEELYLVKRMENYQSIGHEPLEANEKLETQIKFLEKRVNSIKSKFKNLSNKGIKNPKYAYIQLFKK